MANILRTLSKIIFSTVNSSTVETPNSGQATIGIDSTTKKLFSIDDSGTVTNYGEGGGLPTFDADRILITDKVTGEVETSDNLVYDSDNRRVQIQGNDFSGVFGLVAAASGWPQFIGGRSRGTLTSNSPVLDDDIITEMKGLAFDGSSFSNAGRVRIRANQNHDSDSHGTRFEIYLVPDDSTTETLIAILTPDGALNLAAGGAFKVNGVEAVMESDYDSHTILAATTDNTPTARTIGEAQIVGRQTGGNIGGIAQVSADEKTAGTETALRAFSPDDVKDMIDTFGKAILYHQVLGSTTSSINVYPMTTIPATKYDLHIRAKLRTNKAAASAEGVKIKINDDTSNNYSSLIIRCFHNGTLLTWNGSPTNASAPHVMLYANAASAPSNEFACYDITIYGYAGTVANKQIQVRGGQRTRTSNPATYFYDGYGSWHPATPAAVTKVELIPADGNSFIAGCEITAWLE